MLWDLMVMGWLWEVTGRGINGAPTTPSRSWISVFWSPKSDDDLEDSTLGFIHDFMLCQALLVPLLTVKISSGMGTSSTVWSPSSRVRLGQSFFITEREIGSRNQRDELRNCGLILMSMNWRKGYMLMGLDSLWDEEVTKEKTKERVGVLNWKGEGQVIRVLRMLLWKKINNQTMGPLISLYGRVRTPLVPYLIT